MDHPTDGRLVRGIRRWDLVAMVINSVVGAGIFGLPARVFAMAGPYSLLAYIVCAVPVMMIVLCFAEVSGRFRETGGPYLYARAAFGPFVGFEIGWLAWLARLAAFAALCNLFVDYLTFFVPGAAAGFGRGVTITIAVSCLAATNVLGIRVASFATNLFTVGKLVPLLLVVVAGIFVVDPAAYSFATPPGYGSFSAAVLLLVFAFSGFENAVIPAGEVLDPRRHIPFALFTGTGAVLVLYVLVQAVCIGILPNLASAERPLADAGSRLFGGAGAALISLGALVSVAGTMNALMLAAPRLFYAMAEQGQLPALVSATHRRFHTPHVAILLSAAGMLVIALSGTFASAATMSTVIRLVTYGATCGALPALRRAAAPQSVGFVVPAGTAVSVAGLVLVVWLFSSSSGNELSLGGIAAILGVPAYWVARRRSASSTEVVSPAG